MRMRGFEAITSQGRIAVALAEQVAGSLRTEAGRRDLGGKFSREAMDEVVLGGLGACTVSTKLGGGGVRATSDLIAITAALGKGDGSVAICTNMHLGAVRGLGGLSDAPVARSILLGGRVEP